MKTFAGIALFLSAAACAPVFAQQGDMQGMNMHGAAPAAGKTHEAVGVVKAVDPARGKVTLQHQPILSLKWPAMTMAFPVRDKALLDKLQVGKKVEVELVQDGKDYVITAVR